MPLSLPLAALQGLPEATPQAPFTHAGEALFWATEVLRRRRLPRSSAPLAEQVALSVKQQQAVLIERLNLAAEATATAGQWGQRWQPNLPHDADGRLSLALKIDAALRQLPPASHQLLRLWAWGDWAEEGRLNAALVHQEKLRQQGIRARLSYRYSTAQLALLLAVSKATVWRQLQGALAELNTALARQNIVQDAPLLDAETDPAKKLVKLEDFGK